MTKKDVLNIVEYIAKGKKNYQMVEQDGYFNI